MAEYYVFILVSLVAPKTYTGSTPNLEKRLREHNSGSNAYSRKYKPWKIVYSEKFPTKTEAQAREKYFKTHAGRRRIRQIVNNIPW